MKTVCLIPLKTVHGLVSYERLRQVTFF